MKTVAIVVAVILVTLVALFLSAGDKPEELEKYSSIEVGLGLLFVTTPFWFPLVFALLMIPSNRTKGSIHD